MIIKSFEVNKIKLNQHKYFLLYGENNGAKEDFTKSILKEKFIKSEIYYENEVLNNFDVFIESISSKSFFDNEKIIIVKKSTNKITSYVEEIFEKNFDDLILILDADLLDKKSKLRNFFEKQKKAICVPFYSDTHQTLRIIAERKIRENKINLSPQSINLVIDKCNGSREHLKTELDKIYSLYLTKKNISTDDLAKIINLGNQNTVSELIDLCLSKNKKKISKMISENYFSGEEAILILRTLLSKTKRLLKLKIEHKEQSIDSLISSHKPTIFWKDKEIVKQQLKIWDIIDIRNLISEINEREYFIKKTPLQAGNMLNDFLFEIATKVNN